jgi:transposase InsO family protein
MLLVAARRNHPTWGPKKLVGWLRGKGHEELPSPSTAGSILKRQGLVEDRRRRTRQPHRAGTVLAHEANDLWCADYKGQFKSLDGNEIYPMTVTDRHSRYLLRCIGLTDTSAAAAWRVFEGAFREFGLPRALRTDNGSPFASSGLARLTTLSVWWIKLGIELQRIQPGHPQQNGQHERMHRTLKQETVSPPAADLREQQQRFDAFRLEFNEERPHEALGQKPPATLYRPSSRTYNGKIEPHEYPVHFEVRKVCSNGMIPFRMHNIYANECLGGEYVGLVEVDDGVWRVYFRRFELGLIDERSLRRRGRIGSGRVLPMSPV